MKCSNKKVSDHEINKSVQAKAISTIIDSNYVLKLDDIIIKEEKMYTFFESIEGDYLANLQINSEEFIRYTLL